jgi:acetyltransferase-like isoleucine patch superfamily enzyme
VNAGDSPRKLPGDWFPGVVPANVRIDEGGLVESTHSFHRYRSEQPAGISIGHGAAVYAGTVFDAGPSAQIRIGEFALLNSVWITCESSVEIGAYTLISWGVCLFDSYRLPLDPAVRLPLNRAERRLQLERFAAERRWDADPEAHPIRIGRNVWIGFDVCVLPGVEVGEGSIIGAGSVVNEDVPPYTVAAGNPLRRIRELDPGGSRDG